MVDLEVELFISKCYNYLTIKESFQQMESHHWIAEQMMVLAQEDLYNFILKWWMEMEQSKRREEIVGPKESEVSEEVEESRLI